MNVYYTTPLAQIEKADTKGALVKAKVQIKHFFIFRRNHDDYNRIRSVLYFYIMKYCSKSIYKRIIKIVINNCHILRILKRNSLFVLSLNTYKIIKIILTIYFS